MFEALKKKFSGFIDSFSKKELQEEQSASQKAVEEIHNEQKKEEIAFTSQKEVEEIRNEQKKEEIAVRDQVEPLNEGKVAISNEKIEESKMTGENADQFKIPHTKSEPKITAASKVKGLIFGRIKISERDAEPFIDDLRMGLIQSDVNYDVAEKLSLSIKRNLVGTTISSRGINLEISEVIHRSVMDVLSKSPGVDVLNIAVAKKANGDIPLKIMFIGPNGAGKTTTMAKIANILLKNNISCVLSASDTFRAAAIEQTAFHASNLGINVIKGAYGADPASVAFDAIAHAKAHGIDAVLIDSAGRQETNKSLVDELRKMVRVAKPDIKIFVGESISGNALLDQVKVINEAVGIDGIILTKLDCDAKGGNTLSILSETSIPILFFCTGEKYEDIIKYDAQFIADSIIPPVSS